MTDIELTDADYDDMHHALGRPDDAWADTYRNYYCTGKDTPIANRFRQLGVWNELHTINDGRDSIFAVNNGGRAMMADWLKARSLEREG